MPNTTYEDILGAITNIQEGKSSVAAAIEAKGVTVPQDASLGAYASLIMQIESGSTPTPTPDSSVKYGIRCGAMYTEAYNAAYFNTGYIPGPNTIIRFAGALALNGTITHGSADPDTSSDSYVYRIFGFDNGQYNVYCDRRGDGEGSYRLNTTIEDTYAEWEFGNNYIKQNGEIIAEDSSLDSTWSTDLPICIFGGAAPEGASETWYCEEGGDCAWFVIAEPSTNDEGFEEIHHYVAANDASGNVCWYDQIDKTFLYPTGSFVGYANPDADPYIYELNDSSSNDSSTLTLSVDSSVDSGYVYYAFSLTGSGSHGDVRATVWSDNEYTAADAQARKDDGENFDEDTFFEAFMLQHSFDASLNTQYSYAAVFNEMPGDSIYIEGFMLDENNEYPIDSGSITTDTYEYVEEPKVIE